MVGRSGEMGVKLGKVEKENEKKRGKHDDT